MPIQTVTEVNQSIKLILENSFSFIAVVGEVSNLRIPHSGHLYFSLKDEKSQIKAVMFKLQQRYLSQTPEDGMKVLCHGRVSVYEPRGEYQLIIDRIEYKGAGSLQIAFEKLKARLADEGLFDQCHKKQLPFLPGKIAVITSPRGAAIQDFLKVAGTRCPSVPIDIYPVRVQGEAAATEICESIQLINKIDAVDIIVLCRGGGSIEDLWSFNDESLARAIFHSTIPVISAVGHEIDFTIADFTADLRAATPTAAAEAALPDARILREKIDKCQKKMAQSLKVNISILIDKISSLKRIMGNPGDKINYTQTKIDYAVTKCITALATATQKKRYRFLQSEDRFFALSPQILVNAKQKYTQTTVARLTNAMVLLLEHRKLKLNNQLGLLNAVSPQAVLDRGYAIVQSLQTKKIIRSRKQVTDGDVLNIQVTDGIILTQVLPDKGKCG